MHTPHRSPLPFDAAAEVPDPDEARTTQSLIETMREIQQTVLEDSGHAERSVHAKSYGLLEAEFRVDETIEAPYVQGLFQPGAVHPAVVRLSAIPGDILPDEITLPRGFSLKLFEVDGARLPGSEADSTQDFVMTNGPTFIAGSPKQFLANLKMLEKTTDKVEGLKKAASFVNRNLEAVLKAFGGESAMLKAMGGAPMTHPLGDTFYSQSAFRYGDLVAKFSLAPASPELKALAEQKVDIKGRPNGYRELIIDHIAQYGGEWDFRVQLRTHPDMSIDDPSKEWDQDESPFRPVGRLIVKPQTAWSEARSKAVDDAMSFSVWHGVEAHQPLGPINRVRRANYAAAADFRRAANGCPLHEPTLYVALP